tara:strand:- start:253 stop:492 length:240 start_codon:yes stop_codon:yes gene_type:complete
MTTATQFVWRTARETAEILGISRTRVNQLARDGRFGLNAYKKYSAELNYNGVWYIPFPNEYKRQPEGRPLGSKSKTAFI